MSCSLIIAATSHSARGRAASTARLVELVDLALAAPAAKARGAGGKLPRPASPGLARHAFRDKAENNVGGPGERHKQLLGGGTTSRAVQDGDLQVPQHVPIPHQQIDVLDRVFDCEDAGPGTSIC